MDESHMHVDGQNFSAGQVTEPSCIAPTPWQLPFSALGAQSMLNPEHTYALPTRENSQPKQTDAPRSGAIGV